jgi:hypothetical protein
MRKSPWCGSGEADAPIVIGGGGRYGEFDDDAVGLLGATTTTTTARGGGATKARAGRMTRRPPIISAAASRRSDDASDGIARRRRDDTRAMTSGRRILGGEGRGDGEAKGLGSTTQFFSGEFRKISVPAFFNLRIFEKLKTLLSAFFFRFKPPSRTLQPSIKTTTLP